MRLSDVSDDLLIVIFVRAPLATHQTARSLCARLNALLTSPGFARERVDSGYAEHAVIDAGGRRRGRPTAAIWLPDAARVRPSAPPTVMRFRACSAVLDDELWVISGCRVLPHAISDEIASVEAYDPARDAWQARAPLAQPRRGAVAAVVVRDGPCDACAPTLIVAGGRCSSEVLASAEAYDARGGEGGAGAWRALPPLPCATWYAMSAALGGVLYVIGGKGCRRVQAWDGRAWRLRADLPVARHDAGCAVLAGRLTLFGGWVADDAGAPAVKTASVIAYDADADRWEERAPLPAPRATCRAIAHAGGVVLVGGGGPALRYAAGDVPEVCSERLPGAGDMECAAFGSVLYR